METLTYAGHLVIKTCWCGIRHAIPSQLAETANHDKNFDVFCPLGHRWVSSVHEERESEKLRKKLERAEKDKEWLIERRNAAQEEARHQERRAAALKGVVTKIKKRIANGVCPCCNRTFADVKRHMKSQHPNYDPVREAEKKVAAVSG